MKVTWNNYYSGWQLLILYLLIVYIDQNLKFDLILMLCLVGVGILLDLVSIFGLTQMRKNAN